MSSLTAPLYVPTRPSGAVTRTLWAWVRVLGGAGILGLLLWRLGTAGFLDGLRVINVGTLLAATGLGLLTTVFSAWRWCLVARGLGLALPLRGAVADYYRALFLNAALPGGVLGDVHRAVRHGKDAGDVGRGVRAVVLERSAGQVVLVAVGVVALLALPSPVLSQARRLALPGGGAALAVAGGFALAAGAVAIVATVRRRRRDPAGPGRAVAGGDPSTSASDPSASAGAAPAGRGSGRRTGPPGRATGRWGRSLRTAGRDLRLGLLTPRTGPAIVLASAVVLAGHLATFLVAARAAGSSAPVGQLAPLMLLALLAMALPLNIGGWGPREGVCAWAFGAAGLGATQGLTIAVVYGLFAFVASLPGAGVLLVRWATRLRRS